MAKKKKLLKKLAKAALIGGALYGGSKLLKNRGASKLTEGDIGIGLNAPYIGDVGQERKNRWKYSPVDPGPTLAAKGGRIGAKKGGHVKSMGIAKRGGGAAKR